MGKSRSNVSADTKAHILREAEILFAEKGFKGTSLDEIAQKIGITKAAIYYHFKSKDEILKIMIQSFIEEALHIRKQQDELFDSINVNDPNVSLDSLIDRFVTEMIDFLEPRFMILKIILMESIKNSDDIPAFTIMKKYFKAGLDAYKGCCGETEQEQVQELMIEEFFMCYIPLLNFIVFQDKWCDYHGMEKSFVKELFSYVFGRYLKEKLLPADRRA